MTNYNQQQLRQGTVLKAQKYTYTIREVLGQGGFGITYLASTELWMEGELGRLKVKTNVAIKEFFLKDHCERDSASGTQMIVPSIAKRETVDGYRLRFNKEARNLSKLQHEHIVKVLEVFEANNTAYIAMEFVEGTSLAEYVRAHGALSEAEAIGYIRQVAAALDYMHAPGRQIMHLDLKPTNILRQPDGTIKVIDFGLSKQYDAAGEAYSSINPAGISKGYSPIELDYVGSLREFSPTIDIYSLGATLYFLLTAQTPPEASVVLNYGLPPFPATWSKGMQDCITQAMEPRQKDRPQSMEAFLALLGEVKLVEEEKPKVVPEEVKQVLAGIISGLKKVPMPQAEKETLPLVEVETKALDEPPRQWFEPEMVYVEGGTFTMGSPKSEEDHRMEEIPHQVILSSFHIGKYPVTQGQWKAVMGSNPSEFKKGDNYPVENVSWYYVQVFLQKLNAATGKQYRLPTEAEWEYAARGGNQSKGYRYSGSNSIDSVAWHSRNSDETHPVGQKSPNELGIYDMSGNVEEWCNDWYGDYPLRGGQTNPKGGSSGSYRVKRGGSWRSLAFLCRIAQRGAGEPAKIGNDIGFRLVLP
jgi:formylglycine-generating enzyme required for sulfatase activity/predicted Ser/Thr protein kinase